ncbi:cytochrome P450 [Coprinellus micaceus]|uniref:Cytochrome P450 n=1 Tax=Coprinellus micaceus TaxID=71717 RepID=A0A4Y7TK21_COPMI|nr:cytochrome P450 [Coprinellus micaceus]
MAGWTELLACVIAAFFFYKWFKFYRLRVKLAHIPTLGSDSFLWSYLDAWRFISKGHTLIEDGYAKYKGQPFKVACHTTQSGWLVVVNDPNMIEDMRKASPEVLSFRGAAIDLVQTKYTSPRNFKATPFHVPVVRSPLTKAFPTRFARCCGRDQGQRISTDWTPFPLYQTLTHVVCRTTNRLFVDLPLLLAKSKDCGPSRLEPQPTFFAITPNWLKPVVGPLMPCHALERRAKRILARLIQVRLAKHAAHGTNWEGPVMFTNFLSIHTTALVRPLPMVGAFFSLADHRSSTQTSTDTLFDLAARPEYIAPLRAEIDEAIACHGWTKDALARLVKLDSFMKESGRFGGNAAMAMRRRACQDFAFSNGVVIPQDVTVCVARRPMQLDSDHYEDPLEFKGFRFAELREKEGAGLESLQHQMVSLDPTYMLFGYGRNACPGRFFAVNEVKVLLAHIIRELRLEAPR